MADYWWAALGLVLIIEGIGPMLFPNKWRSYLKKSQSNPQLKCSRWGEHW